jgi:hypothetical protein
VKEQMRDVWSQKEWASWSDCLRCDRREIHWQEKGPVGIVKNVCDGLFCVAKSERPHGAAKDVGDNVGAGKRVAISNAKH